MEGKNVIFTSKDIAAAQAELDRRLYVLVPQIERRVRRIYDRCCHGVRK